jgi:hypothetical protein
LGTTDLDNRSCAPKDGRETDNTGEVPKMISGHLVIPDRIERPWYAWIGAALAAITALGALPVGWSLIGDPSGAAIGLPSDWIANSVFGTYMVPGVYLFFMNGLGMIALVGLVLIRHWFAPWWMGTLAVGLIAWIAIQFVLMPETSWLQVFFLASGFALGLIALFWLRRTGQLRLW